MGSENLAETLGGEAALLDAHTASWIVHLPPLLRSAKAEIESLRASLTRVEEERIALTNWVDAELAEEADEVTHKALQRVRNFIGVQDQQHRLSRDTRAEGK